MAGFGRGKFGQGPFGRADWSKLVLHENVPPVSRKTDEDAGGYFAAILDAIKPSLDFLLQRVRDFTSLRHPGFVTSKYSVTESIEITSTEKILDADSDGWGQHIQLFCATSPVDIGADWKTEINDTTYTVIRVNRYENRIDVTGIVEPSVGTASFYRPEQLSTLYADYGLTPDRYFNDTFMRGELEHAVSWLNVKGANTGYAYRGRMSGYDVAVYPCWKIDPIWLSELSDDEYFQYPDGSGTYYTVIAPRFVLFDEYTTDFIPADTLSRDIDASLLDITTYLLTDVVVPDGELTVDSEYQIEAHVAVVEIADVSNWTIIDSSGSEFALESQLTDRIFTVRGSIEPQMGACTFRYNPPVVESSMWCKSNLVKLIIEQNDTFETVEEDPGDAGTRLIGKLNDVKPAHVMFVDVTEV